MNLSSQLAFVVRTKSGWSIYEKTPQGKPGRLFARAANAREVRHFLMLYENLMMKEEEF